MAPRLQTPCEHGIRLKLARGDCQCSIVKHILTCLQPQSLHNLLVFSI